MADEIDAAQEREEFYQDLALRKALKRTIEEEPLMINGHRHCLECEEKIPKARLKANPKAVRCVYCQDRKERRA